MSAAPPEAQAEYETDLALQELLARAAKSPTVHRNRRLPRPASPDQPAQVEHAAGEDPSSTEG